MKIKNIVLALLLSLMPLNSVWAELKDKDYQEDSNLISPITKVDYNPLAELLREGKWRKANDETRDLLLQATGRKATGWVTTDNIKTLSCWDLKTIDSLWKQYSQGKFGFSVQLPIFLETGNRPGKLVGDDAYIKFGDRIGWRQSGTWLNYSQLTFATTAPLGHLPAAHLTWSGLKRGQSWQWYGGTEEDVRFIEGKSLLERRDF